MISRTANATVSIQPQFEAASKPEPGKKIDKELRNQQTYANEVFWGTHGTIVTSWPLQCSPCVRLAYSPSAHSRIIGPGIHRFIRDELMCITEPCIVTLFRSGGGVRGIDSEGLVAGPYSPRNQMRNSFLSRGCYSREQLPCIESYL